ncbi:conserved hypothetical membrane protein [Azoarcus olearius]|uniref:Conserved hypothetical membrane protein n=1 Tax=Azoarcus sp. (strain BH72) TaxID=418699 RepID=A1KBW3_AZOSB|nr:hypothetical protein dqs_3848 [Azoarcus olearius]CAL96319.1 conserved hypothetical membrane protein [Azoarcus olearius]
MAYLETKLPAPLLALAIAAGMWLVWRDAPVFGPDAELRVAVSVAIAQVSAALVLAAGFAFWRARTTIDPRRPERAATLVTYGIYRFSRNPMYLSLLLLLLAYAIRLGAPVALAGPVVFAAYVTRFQVLPEERALEAKFGLQYADYCRRVRRWL